MSAPSCPCGSGDGYEQCCGPLLDGERDATTAEALMRSRYTAFARGRPDHLQRTWDPRTVPRDLALDPSQSWTRLRILDVVAGTEPDDTGIVEFRAHYRRADEPHVLHERSTFRRHRGRWVYVDGQQPT